MHLHPVSMSMHDLCTACEPLAAAPEDSGHRSRPPSRNPFWSVSFAKGHNSGMFVVSAGYAL